MKTTIDIADDLIKRARTIQNRDDVTFRSLVEEGLRHVLEKRSKPGAKRKFEMLVVGEPYKPGMPVPDVARMLAEANDRPWLEREFPRSRVAEPVTSHSAGKAKSRRKKK